MILISNDMDDKVWLKYFQKIVRPKVPGLMHCLSHLMRSLPATQVEYQKVCNTTLETRCEVRTEKVGHTQTWRCH